MDIRTLRKEMGLSQGEFASRVGLSSKGYVSKIEAANRCSVKVALEIERLSNGRIPASSINESVAVVEGARA